MAKCKAHTLPFVLFDEFAKAANQPAVLDDLISGLTISYERAQEEGIAPLSAIAAVLDWALAEMKKYKGLETAEC